MQLRRTLFALALAGVAVTGCSAETSQDVSQKGQQATLCGTFETIDVLGNEYVINNNVWNGDGQCIEAFSDDTYFQVVEANHNNTTAGAPASYPSIYKGCHWGDCTVDSGLPVQTGSVPAIASSWDVTTTGQGAYNVAYDLWFNSTSSTSSQPDEAELMIWLDHSGGPVPFGSQVGTVSLAGATWELWQGPMDGWHYIAYRRTSGTNSVSNLDLSEFIKDASNRGYIDPNSYLVTIEAGFEIWQGGQGLTQNSFSADVGSSGDGGTDDGGSDDGGTDDGGSDDGSSGGTCEATYEAENMTATTGGSISGGWNLWSNGSLSTSHDFVSGDGTVTVVAKGDQAGGEAPHMVVSIGGTTIGDADVSATSWTSYSFNYSNNPGGVQDLTITFDNDYYNSSTGEDRNLHVDKATVACSTDGGGTTASCSDGVLNQDETDVDCGGSCSACSDGSSCSTNSDCQSGNCNNGTCEAAASCTDGVQNGDETDVDCGGSCNDCSDGSSCSTNSDCSSGNCSNGTCEATASCTDGVQNGDETDVDCGGSCNDCSDGSSCSTNSDCSSGNCNGGTCESSSTDGDTGSGDVTGSLVLTNNWDTGYCADLTVSSSADISTWTVELDTNQSVIYDTWNANFDGSAPNYTVTPFSWNSSISAGGSVTVGFCSDKTGSNWEPEVSSATGN